MELIDMFHPISEAERRRRFYKRVKGEENCDTKTGDDQVEQDSREEKE